ncbi:MAG: minor capsid protein [Patescibacteria group bacterium]|nr:minor capsid protein [Patescibacteria group bacterium]
MVKATLRRIGAAWRRNPPELAEDASPAVDLRETVERLRHAWEDRFEELASGPGRRFAKDATEHADRAFAAQLRKAGFTVKFRMTRAANDVLQAAISENVSLIKSIPEHFFTQVESIVTEGVRAGRDMNIITKGLQDQLSVTKRRAATIARDQSNKASAAILRVRQQEVGITEAIWLHSGGGRHPRPSHVAMDGGRYDVAKGMWDRDEKAWIWPGQLINCRCVSRAVVAGLE